MNSKPITVSIVAICLTAGSFAFAQGNDRFNDRDRHEQFQRGPDRRPDFRPGPPDNRGRAHVDRRDWRGAGPRHDLYRGQRLPTYYRGRQYVVNDWRLHRLSPPPRGYYWVQVGADYVLVAIATGVIAQLVLQ